MNDSRADRIRNDAHQSSAARWSRRGLLLTAAGTAVTLGMGAWLSRRRRPRSPLFIASRQSYSAGLVQTIRDGLIACGLTADRFRNKYVLLKPNMVEPSRDAPHMTTHPAMVLAAAEVFLQFGARVVVGEAPGHLRDSELALLESGIGAALDDMQLPFADLNYEEVAPRKNRGGASGLQQIWFPKTVHAADWIVSMPKMKTHHWVGVTLSMKNLYGTIPGIKYGWPKNVLHHHGIAQTVYDINATLPSTLAIVDGIECMEGDGPIMGSPKHLGIVAVGPHPISVDATLSRIMGIDPERVSYLRLAANRLGTIHSAGIEQRGERWQELVSPFQIMDRPHLQRLRLDGPLVT